MNLKYSKMSVFGIMAVYKQEKWNSDPLNLDIKEDNVLGRNNKKKTVSMQYIVLSQNLNCKFFMIGNRFSTSVLI